ncbi:hypothetical protein [Nitrincola iocasae]|uniref:Uncharacterized protein n=1 Tax=Nitrincola iocasae TaxID=2614693 RepID=A0A5J6LBE6_9GAMM|nr:hypothetical protein [Nitrincola iocasae]QEW05621.1 hypothetical protein F5I99_03450 [Nitrincola iocasae]
MNLSRCPVCHSRLHLDALVQDESGRDLLALLAKLDRSAGAALVSYLSLFRSKQRDLANDRALRIANEALALAPLNILVPALVQTVEQLRSKQQAGDFKPLSNHRYLTRVLEGYGHSQAQPEGDILQLPSDMQTENVTRAGRRSAVSAAVMDIKDTDW